MSVTFFLISLITIVACAAVAAVAEVATKGNGGKLAIVIVFLVAIVGAFLAHRWDNIGVWTTDMWIQKMAVFTIIAMALVISAIGTWAGRALYHAMGAKSDPAWLEDDEEAAIEAISMEKSTSKLRLAATDAPSYRVRSIANEKLGQHQAARYEIAMHDPDETTSLAALDDVDWKGWGQLLADIAIHADRESVATKALDMMEDDRAIADVAARAKNARIASRALGLVQDDDSLADIASEATNEQIAMKALGRIKSANAMERLCKQFGPNTSPAQLRFEAGRWVGDSKVCAAALDDFLAENVDGIAMALGSIQDAGFLAEVVAQWLAGRKDASAIVERLKEKVILQPPIDENLVGYCCPNGQLHDLESHIEHKREDSDEYDGVISCRNCGYMCKVDGATYKSGAYGFGFDDKHVVCKSGGYVCASCGTVVQPESDGPAPCVCPTCGNENHSWEHIDGEFFNRDYSSGISYDVCWRCGKKGNVVSRGSQ